MSKLGHLLKAFMNIDQIYEGIKNKTFKKDHIEAVAEYRWNYCYKCDQLDKRGTDCVVAKTQPCCKDCGCSLAIKIRSLSTECPLKKWGPIMPDEAEEKLRESINLPDES